MKFKELLFAIFVVVLLPGIMFSAFNRLIPRKQPLLTEESTAVEYVTQDTQADADTELPISVLMPDGEVCVIDAESYVVGVLLGEMPMDFDIEALKAQAVVARTYSLRRFTVAPKHAGNSVCTDPACCQDYCSVEEYLQNGGNESGVHKARSAASATAGQVLTYNDLLIEATYFSCSGGRTEDALAVWGTEIPYLQAVDSPGEENATHHTDSISISAKEFASRLNLQLSGNPANWFGKTTYTSGNGVDTMVIGGVTFKGTQLRQMLGIRSTAFTLTPVGDTVHIFTKGFGHRVGMSQYGAEAMAVGGSNYEEILSHYYPGTRLITYNRN